jgi:tetratricopeptide (TPR) repeat protein
MDSLICINLGWAYLRAGQFERSLEWSNRALTLDPHNFFPYRNIGHALLGLGRLKDAKKAYEKAVEERFGDENFRNTLEELDILGRLYPDINGLDQIVAWFQDEQAKIDASNEI